jgi:hypothetical protein
MRFLFLAMAARCSFDLGLFVLLPVAVAAGACATTGARDDAKKGGSTTPSSTSTTPTSSASTGEQRGGDGGALKTNAAAFYPVVEGACPSTRAYAIGNAPVLVTYRDAWVMGAGDDVHALYRMGPPAYDGLSGTYLVADHIGDVGGLDEARAWVQLRLSTGRTEDASVVKVKAGAGNEWKALPTPHGQQGFFGITNILQQPDGSLWTYGQHSMYMDIPGDAPSTNTEEMIYTHNKYFAWTVQGEPLKMNLPGPDMMNAIRMASGEIVAAGRAKTNNKPMLRRWSPTKKVDDLVATNEGGGGTAEPQIAVGTNRAVLLAAKEKHAFYNYMGDKLEKAPISAKVKDVASWVLTASDDLLVASSDGSLVIEKSDGSIIEEKLPEDGGRLATEQSAPWVMAKSGGAVFTRTKNEPEWKKITLPDGAWTNETHPPVRVEWVKVVGPETWVSTVRTDSGFGLKKPGEVRVLYSSRARSSPIRCGAPLPAGTFAAFPPRATSSCTNGFVVIVASELEKDQKPEYPKIGAPLKGDVASFGESLTFVGFGGGPNRLLGILAPTMDIAKTIAKKVPGSEIVCGAPQEHRRLRFDVKTGAFSGS